MKKTAFIYNLDFDSWADQKKDSISKKKKKEIEKKSTYDEWNNQRIEQAKKRYIDWY